MTAGNELTNSVQASAAAVLLNKIDECDHVQLNRVSIMACTRRDGTASAGRARGIGKISVSSL